MKKIIFAIIWLLIGTTCYLAAQTDYPINSQNLPNGWRLMGSARINSQFGRTDLYSIQITDDTSSLITSNLTNVNLLQFSLRSPQNSDDFDLIIDNSSDNVNWVQQSVIPVKSDPSKSTIDNPSDFKALSISYNKIGSVKFRFRIKKKQLSSVLILDDFSVTQMTSEQTNQFVTEEQLSTFQATMRKEILDQVAYTNFTMAQAEFTKTADIAKKNIHLLANLIDKSSGIYLIAGTGEKLAIRNQMVNPWSYDQFKDFVNKIDSKLPEVKKKNLQDIINLVKVPLQLADKFLLGGTLSTFGNSIKSLIGDAFTKTNLLEIGIPKNKISQEVTNGLDIYSKVKIFLEVLMKENDKANFLNSAISEVSQDSKVLMKDSENQLLSYLQFIKMPNPEQEIANLKTNRISTIRRIDQKVNAFYNNEVGLPQNFVNNSKLSPSQNAVLSNTLVLSAQAEDIRKRYPILTTRMTSFYNNLKNDSQSPNPFQIKNSAGVISDLIDITTSEKWDEFKVSLGQGLADLINNFNLTYIQYYLYD